MAAPPAPATPTIGRTAPTEIRVQWVDVAVTPAVTSWTVRWQPAGGVRQTLTGIAADRRAVTLTELTAATAYDVDVRAVNADGNGPYSSLLTITTQEEEQMAILQADLTKVQIGIEAANAAGTLVAATRLIPYNSGSYEPTIERKTLEERGTVLADTDDVVVRRGSTLELTEELNTETLIGALLCSLADVSPTSVGGARRWTFTPAVSAPSGLRTATFEIAATDGAADTYRGRFGFARVTALSVEASADTAELTTTWMGRARQALTTPATVAAPARWIVPAVLFSIYIDDTWAALGTTRYGQVRTLGLDIDPGLTEAPALAGRSDLDTAYWRRGRIRGNLAVVVDHDGDAGSELAHWEAGDLRYVRLEADNGLTGADLRRLRIDTCSRYIDTPDVLAMDGAQHTLDLASQLRADSAGNILRVQITNGLATY